jgi:glycosyltransferase involved in cell wall biosynthesis
VVATRAGGIPDKVVEGETGYLVEPGDVAALAARLGRMAAAPDEARRMGARGRTRARERFAWPALVGRTIALYEELLRDARAETGRA